MSSYESSEMFQDTHVIKWLIYQIKLMFLFEIQMNVFVFSAYWLPNGI